MAHILLEVHTRYNLQGVLLERLLPNLESKGGTKVQNFFVDSCQRFRSEQSIGG
jgi:hypothetical protein